MALYIDGFVLPVPKDNLETYRTMASKACAVWIEHGALEYRECALEDGTAHEMVSYPQLANCKEDETVIFSWIAYRDRAHRDEVNAKVMADPRMNEMCDGKTFDYKRMAYGGFEAIVQS